MAEEIKKDIDQETEQDTSSQELDELTVMQDVDEEDIGAQSMSGEEASTPTDETASRVATKDVKFDPSQEQEIEVEETPISQRLEEQVEAAAATDPSVANVNLNAQNLGLGDVEVAGIQELEDVLERGLEDRADEPFGGETDSNNETEAGAEALFENSENSESTASSAESTAPVVGDSPQTEEQLSSFRGEEPEPDTNFGENDNTDPDPVDPVDPPIDPTPQPLATNLNVRLSNATDQQRFINSNDGYDLTTTEFGKEEVLTGADVDIAGVSDNAEITYTFTDENTVEVTLDSSWNSVKNIEVTSDVAGDVTVNNFVHADINLGGTEASDVTVNGAKRGSITTGGNDDSVEVNSYTNNSGWGNEIEVSTNAGNDVVSLTGDKGITEFTVDAGTGNDNVTIDGDYYGSQVHLGGGDDTFVGGASGDVVHVGSGFDTLTGGGDKDTFVIQQSDGHTIIKDFGGVGGGGHGEANLLPEHDLLKLSGEGLTAENMLLEYTDGNTIITFEGVDNFSITLENFDFTDLDNLPANQSFNIFFNGQTEGTDAFDVFNNHSANQNNIWTADSVTFTNNANDNVSGKDNSDDVINAMGGDDTIDGRGGDDILRGQAGDDTLKGGLGDDTLKGGEGDDLLRGQKGDDVLLGGTGDDDLRGGQGDDVLQGQEGDDVLRGGAGNDTLLGGSGDDTLKGGRGDDVLKGGRGDDVLRGNSGDDILRGGAGDDKIFGGHGDDVLRGGSGNDDLRGNAGDDILKGGRGDDVLRGGQGDDVLKGGSGDDILKAGQGDDVLKGGSGDDVLKGGRGDDILKGGSGDDIIMGGNEARVSETFEHEYESGTPEFPDVSGGRVDMSTMNGLDSNNTTFDHSHDVSINFVSEGAGYKNMLGTYTVDAEGNIVDVQIIETNVSATGSGGTLNAGDVLANMGELPAGTEIQFFTVANGFNRNNFNNENGNNFIDLAEGSLSFVNEDGNPANAGDDSSLELIFTPTNGDDAITINGPNYHSTGANLNPDGKEHVASGINAEGNLQIAFEDLPNQGDADFNDLIIEMEVSPATEVSRPDGADIAEFTGDRSEYNITENNNGSFTIEDTVEGRDGTDTVSQVETFRFNDGDIAEGDLISSSTEDSAPASNDDPVVIIDEIEDEADEVIDDNDELLSDDGNNGHGNDPDGVDDSNPGNSNGNNQGNNGQGNGNNGQGNSFGLDNMDDDNFESESAWTDQIDPDNNNQDIAADSDNDGDLGNDINDMPAVDVEDNDNSNFDQDNNDGFGF